MPNEQSEHSARRHEKRDGDTTQGKALCFEKETTWFWAHCCETRLSQLADGILQRRVLGLIIVFGVDILDLRLSEIQLCLSQLDDRR